jgi:O-antigen ligase
MNPMVAAGWGVLITAVLLPQMALFVPLGVAPLGVMAALASLPLVLRTRAWRHFPAPLLWLPLALAAWALVSCTWALDPREAFLGTIRQVSSTIVGMIVFGAALELDDGWRRKVGWALLGSLLLAGAFLSYEAVTDKGLTFAVRGLRGEPPKAARSMFGRGASIFTLAACAGLVLSFWLRKRWLGIALVLAGLTLVVGDSFSTRVAVLLAIAIGSLAWWRPGKARALLAVAVVAATILGPVAAKMIPDPHYTFQHWRWVPMSSHHRLTIWQFTAQRIFEKPVLGWGMEASRSIPGADDEIRVWRYGPDGERTDVTLLEPQLPLHPHNAILQLWLELGAMGGLLFAAFMVCLFRTTTSLSDGLARAASTGAAAAGLVVASVSFGFWQSWWQAALWLCASFVAMAVRQDRPA